MVQKATRLVEGGLSFVDTAMANALHQCSHACLAQAWLIVLYISCGVCCLCSNTNAAKPCTKSCLVMVFMSGVCLLAQCMHSNHDAL